MPQTTGRPRPVMRPARWTAALLTSMAWMVVIALAITRVAQHDRILVASAGLASAALTFGIAAWVDRARWRRPVEELTHLTRSLRQGKKSGQALTLPPAPELAELTREIAALARPPRPREMGTERPAPRPPADPALP